MLTACSDKTYSVAPTEIVVEDDPPLKPYKPDPPEVRACLCGVWMSCIVWCGVCVLLTLANQVVQKLIDEIRAEAANRDREIPDPYALS